MISQLPSLLGAALVLAAYFGSQSKKISEKSLLYFLLNFFGSAILCLLAFRLRQWGFVAINGAWALISALSYVRRGP